MANTADSDGKLQIARLIRDPELVKNRIFIGNLPVCTREEVQSICFPYGNVLGSMVQKNFGFVQFESEEIANKAASALNKSMFKGNIITVRNAGTKVATQNNIAKRGLQRSYTGNPICGENNMLPVNVVSAPVDAEASRKALMLHMNNDFNDCEIIVVDRRNTKYAEYIEDRLKRINLRVDVLFPNLEVGLGKVLTSITARGCLYAVLVTMQHEEHNSITVNILHGQPAEHRNMPLEDAIKLIADDFQNNVIRNNQNFTQQSALGSPAILAKSTIAECHPDFMQTLLNRLANNMSLTVLQYDNVITYLQGRREQQVKVELGNPTNALQQKKPDPEILIQKKILNILKKQNIIDQSFNLLYPTIEHIKRDVLVLDLLKNSQICRALDVLIDSKLAKTIEQSMKFTKI